MELWPHQEKAIHDLRAGFAAGHPRQILQLKTGLGKTMIAAEIARSAVEKGHRVAFVAPLVSLIDQTLSTFQKYGLECGVQQGSHWCWRPQAPVQVCSIQTLARRRLPDCNFFILDEVHILFKAHKDILENYDACPVIGLSATPWRKALGKYFTNLVNGPTMEEAIAGGYLVPWIGYAPSAPDLSKVRMTAGDYNGKDLAKASNTKVLVADIVRTWLDLGEGRQTLCFATDIAHSKHIVQQFNERGVNFAHIDAYDDSQACHEVIQRFKRGDIVGISSVGKLTTGFDAPNASCLIMARATKSQMLYHQQIGRGIRAAEGKKDCIILDHAGNLVDERLNQPPPTTLCRGDLVPQVNIRPEPVRKKCPQCHYLKPLKVHVCPACGFAPKKQDSVEVVGGELIHVKGKKIEHDMATKRRWYAELKALCLQYGYNDGWLAHKYRARFSVWPNGLKHLPPASAVSPEVQNWVRYQNIRYAKSKTARASA